MIKNNKEVAHICEVLSFFLVLLAGSSLSGITICPVAEARELFVFLPLLTGGSGGGSPLCVADEFFERLSWLFVRLLTTFCGISFALSEPDDDSDFDLQQEIKRV